MTDPVLLPAWLALLLALLDRLLFPSLRWFLRRRVEGVIDRLNARLRLRIHPFKLTRRAVLVDRLCYDPRILEAVEAHMCERGEPREAVMAGVLSDVHPEDLRGPLRVGIRSVDLATPVVREIGLQRAGVFEFDRLPEGRYVMGAYRDRDSSGTYGSGRPFLLPAGGALRAGA